MLQKNLPANKSHTRKKIENFSYGLNDTIGKGYSSQVYRGRNDSTEEPVAVKVIDLKMLKCQINRTLLASQIEILKSMRNIPHVLTLHEVYTTKNNTYIITELCDTDLSAKIKRGLTETEALNYMSQIIEGYSYIHEKNLIHRDLKPANLLITKTNDLKIADFGFGVKADEVAKPSKYNVGSPLYMAPQSLKRNEYSFKTDIWALGIIFFEMLTGNTPWRAKNEKELVKKIEGEQIEEILLKQKFSNVAKEFLKQSLCQEKGQRLGPQELARYDFTKSQEVNNSILGEKQLNSATKAPKMETSANEVSSPKNMNYIGKSLQKKAFINDKSQRKLPSKNLISATQNIQNVSLKSIEGGRKNCSATSPSKETQTVDVMAKEDKKFVSKLLIAEVHFCRFLYKLSGQIKESCLTGLFKDNPQTSCLLQSFTQIIEQKVTKLKEFESVNFLGIDDVKFHEYRQTTDHKKLVKIAKDYYNRYSTQLSEYWMGITEKSLQTVYRESVQEVTKSIEYLLESLQFRSETQFYGEHQLFLGIFSKDIIILDYLITCKQLLEMIEKEVRINGNENYQKFARKSRIEEIVEGSTSEINAQLFKKIMERGVIIVKGRRDRTE